MITDILLWLIRKLNKCKDRCLAQRLHDMSLDYDPHVGDLCRIVTHVQDIQESRARV